MATGSEQLRSLLRIRVSQAMDDAIDAELSAAARQFCMRSSCWQEDITLQTASDRQEYILISGEPGAQIYQILGVHLDGRPVSAWTGDYGRPAREVYGKFETYPEGVSLDAQLALVRLMAAPGPDLPLVVRVSLIPEVGSYELPTMVLHAAQDGILALAECGLRSHTRRPYANVERAAVCRREFLAHLSRVKSISYSRHVRSEVGWLYPQNFAPGGRRT